jgi:hypothetical protein
MYDFLGGRVGVLFFVGAAWLAGLVRFADGRFMALARLATFGVFFFIVGVLEVPKGPERTPCETAVEMYCGQSVSSWEEQREHPRLDPNFNLGPERRRSPSLLIIVSYTFFVKKHQYFQIRCILRRIP